MANKKYTDFSAGTYDTSKIFLQADATTGDLEKINLPTIPTTWPYYADTPNSDNSGSNPQTTATITFPANTLPNVGDQIEIVAAVKYNTASGTKTVQIDFNGLTNSSSSSTGSVYKMATGYITRISSTQVVVWLFWQTLLSVNDGLGPSVLSWSIASTFTLNLKVTAGAASDIKTYFLSAEIRLT